MSSKPMWMVRAGEGAHAATDFRDKNVVGIGWGEEDWTQYSNRDAIMKRLSEQSPELSHKQALAQASQIDRFLRGIQVTDRILSYDASRRIYLLGSITSQPNHDPKVLVRYPTLRKVSWEAEVRRDDLSVATRNSLGAIMALFRVPDEAAQEIVTLAAGKTKDKSIAEEEEIEGVVDVLKDIQSRSHEFIKDRLSRLDWDQMQQLVAGLLRAMGYKTRVSAQGPDRGKDIEASPDGFGFESPRIVVEVKHRRDAMGSQDIRSFIGGRHKDDKGLFVSTGGFTKDAFYEAERSQIPLTLMDLDELAKTIADHYEKMDPEARALIPLTRIYWPT